MHDETTLEDHVGAAAMWAISSIEIYHWETMDAKGMSAMEFILAVAAHMAHVANDLIQRQQQEKRGIDATTPTPQV